MEYIAYPILFFTSFVANFIAANVGGAGLLLVPVLLFLGLPPQEAIGTRRVASLGMLPTSLYRFGKDKKVNVHIGIGVAVTSIVGAYAGSKVLLLMPEELMQKAIGVFILTLLPLLFLKKDFGLHPREHTNVVPNIVGYALFFVVGFVASFFGGGGQIFGTAILISCFGMTFLEAAGTRKIASLSFAITSLAVYITADIIVWSYGLTLLAGGAGGGYVGAHYGIKKGEKWVRRLFLVIVATSAMQILLQ